MNAIMGMTDLALSTDLTKDQQEYLETVKTSTDSLLFLAYRLEVMGREGKLEEADIALSEQSLRVMAE